MEQQAEIKVIKNVNLKIDDKLDNLIGIIRNLSDESRIAIQGDNIITDHPYVERDMFEVRDELGRMNARYAKHNKFQGKGTFTIHNTAPLDRLKSSNQALEKKQEILNSQKKT